MTQFSLSGLTTRRLLLGLLVVLLVGFVVQIVGPLRIDTDVGFYLSIAASFADGHGLRLYGHPSPLPVGNPVLVGLVDRVGLATPSILITLNLLFLLGALILLYGILRRERGVTATTALSLMVLFLSSFVIIKYFPRPRSEEASLFASWAALWCMSQGRQAHRQRKLWLLAAGAVLMVVAISVRAAGLALIPAFVWALVPPDTRLIGTEHRVRSWCLGLGSAVLLGLAVFWAVTATNYVQEWVHQLEASSLQWQLFYTARAKLNELGQLALNVPAGVVPSTLRRALKGVGALVCLILLRALWGRRNNLSTVDVFVLANLGILFLWPGDAPRFWLPILPFVGLYALSVVSDLIPARLRSMLICVYAAIYVALGIVVQVLLTREAFSSKFAVTYGDGSLAGEYRAVVEGPGQGEVDDLSAFRVLLRYHPKASPAWDRTRHQPYRVIDAE